MAVLTLDTSAVMAFLKGEPGQDIVRRVLDAAAGEEASPVLLPFVVPMEVEYTLLREFDQTIIEGWLADIERWPVAIIESTPAWRRVAAAVKYTARLSLADAWVASLALLNDAALVHKDPEFDSVVGLKALRLPYDRDAGRPQ